MIYALGIITGFLFAIVAITIGILLSKNQTFNNTVQKIDECIRPKGEIFEAEDPLEKAKKDIILNGEAKYEN